MKKLIEEGFNVSVINISDTDSRETHFGSPYRLRMGAVPRREKNACSLEQKALYCIVFATVLHTGKDGVSSVNPWSSVPL